ncbi:MAG: LysM peptidoglycan-binding domain-containing protein [Candidatus Saccharimonadales bacterium]
MRKIALTVVPVFVALATLIPATTTSAASAAATKKSNAKVVAQATEQATAEKKTEETQKQPVMVTVAEGDSLSSIAEARGTTWVRLYNANESVVNPDIINPGQQLRVPEASEELADRPLPQPVIAAAPVQTNYQTTYRAPSTSYRSTASAAASYPTDSNAAKAFIYSRESGNNPNATNPNGCYGIGQDCNGVVRGSCGADYACQDAYFTNYAMNRYGSWEAAQSFWNTNGWW